MKEILESNGIKNDIAFYALYGSQNYELDTDDSDKDYVVYLFPTDDEFINGKVKSSSLDYENGQVKVRDVRKLPQLVMKPSISNLELLVSKDSYNVPALNKLLNRMRKELKNQIFLNKKRFLNSSVGVCNSYMKVYHEANSEKHLFRALSFYAIANVSVALADDKKVKFEDCLTVMNKKAIKPKVEYYKALSLDEKIKFANSVTSKIDFLKRLADGSSEDKENKDLEEALNKRLLKVLKGRL